VECSSANHSSSDQSEKPFHLIQPGTAGWGEMEMETLTLLRLEPTLHFGALVGAVVVHDQVHFLIGREILLEMIQEPDELPATMPILAGANDFPVDDAFTASAAALLNMPQYRAATRRIVNKYLR
jgi:hypothetical protein